MNMPITEALLLIESLVWEADSEDIPLEGFQVRRRADIPHEEASRWKHAPEDTIIVEILASNSFGPKLAELYELVDYGDGEAVGPDIRIHTAYMTAREHTISVSWWEFSPTVIGEE